MTSQVIADLVGLTILACLFFVFLSIAIVLNR